MGRVLADLSDIREARTRGGVRLLSADLPQGRSDEVWRDLLDQHPATGWYPVLGPDVATAVEMAGGYDDEVQGPVALTAALAIDPAERFEELRQAAFNELLDYSYYEEDKKRTVAFWRANYEPAGVAAKLAGLTGPGPGVRRVTGEYPPGSVLLVPAAAGYEVPVLVPGLITATNTDLGPVDHLAVLRHWHQRYGAELYFASGPHLELAVTRPPTTTDDVARCAIEQSVYCHDLDQIFGEPEDVARKQARGDYWSFWWD